MSCESGCPPSETIANFQFSDITVSLTNYDDVQSLVFSNSLSEEFTLDVHEKDINNFSLDCIYKPCAKELLDEQCYYAEFERRRFVFKNQDIELEINSGWRNAQTPGSGLDTAYAESIVTIIKSTVYEPVVTEFQSNFRNADPTAPIFSLLPDVVNINEIELIDKLYQNVTLIDSQVWFAADYGLVGFKLEDVIYELKKIIR